MFSGFGHHKEEPKKVEKVETKVQTTAVPTSRVETTGHVSGEKATKEYVEFLNKEAVREAPEVRTEYQYSESTAAPIKLKEQPVQYREQPTIVKEQPVHVTKQPIQVEMEKPIEVTKKSVDVERQRPIEKKEAVIEVVKGHDQPTETMRTALNEGGRTVEYEVKAAKDQVRNLDSQPGHGSMMDRVKDTVGGATATATGALEAAREKAREVFSNKEPNLVDKPGHGDVHVVRSATEEKRL